MLQRAGQSAGRSSGVAPSRASSGPIPGPAFEAEMWLSSSTVRLPTGPSLHGGIGAHHTEDVRMGGPRSPASSPVSPR